MKGRQPRPTKAPVLLEGEGRTDDGRVAISLEEVSLILGIGRSTTYAAAKRGDIPTIPIMGRLLVPVKALQEWLET